MREHLTQLQLEQDPDALVQPVTSPRMRSYGRDDVPGFDSNSDSPPSRSRLSLARILNPAVDAASPGPPTNSAPALGRSADPHPARRPPAAASAAPLPSIGADFPPVPPFDSDSPLNGERTLPTVRALHPYLISSTLPPLTRWSTHAPLVPRILHPKTPSPAPPPLPCAPACGHSHLGCVQGARGFAGGVHGQAVAAAYNPYALAAAEVRGQPHRPQALIAAIADHENRGRTRRTHLDRSAHHNSGFVYSRWHRRASPQAYYRHAQRLRRIPSGAADAQRPRALRGERTASRRTTRTTRIPRIPSPTTRTASLASVRNAPHSDAGAAWTEDGEGEGPGYPPVVVAGRHDEDIDDECACDEDAEYGGYVDEFEGSDAGMGYDDISLDDIDASDDYDADSTSDSTSQTLHSFKYDYTYEYDEADARPFAGMCSVYRVYRADDYAHDAEDAEYGTHSTPAAHSHSYAQSPFLSPARFDAADPAAPRDDACGGWLEAEFGAVVEAVERHRVGLTF
ncbi:hypothetical protein DFH09DRAFT_1366854 [Mycena vulgaris]|nr:hypothetical protein DFH09DRAFT_1366854 [Mycena vulgaris]